jgi:tetratricopeptide (TPR) repeat protein
MKKCWVVLIITLMMAGVVSVKTSRADVITFISGDKLHGEIFKQDNRFISMRLVTGGDIVVDREFVESVVKEPPEVFYVRRGDLYLMKKDYHAALQEYSQADALMPNQKWIQKKINKARRLRSEQINEVIIEHAESLMDKRSYRRAVDTLSQATEKAEHESVHQQLRKRLADAKSMLAYHYFDHCFDEEALETLLSAREYDPYCANVYYVLGRINHARSRYQTAKKDYEKALELDPALVNARDSLLRLEKELEASEQRVAENEQQES